MIHISENKLIKLVQAWYNDTEGRDSFRVWWRDHGREIYTSPMHNHAVDRVSKGDLTYYEGTIPEAVKSNSIVEKIARCVREIMGENVESYRVPATDLIGKSIQSLSIIDFDQLRKLIPEFYIGLTEKELHIGRVKVQPEEDEVSKSLDGVVDSLLEIFQKYKRDLRIGGSSYEALIASLDKQDLADLQSRFNKRDVHVKFYNDYMYLYRYTTLVLDWLRSKCGVAPYMQFPADGMKGDREVVVNLLKLTDEEVEWINEHLIETGYQIRVCKKEGIIEFYSK